MTIAALIVAAGRGTRAGGVSPKQWRTLAGDTVAGHTVRAFERSPRIARIVVVLHPDDMGRGVAFSAQGCLVAQGGHDRAQSVRNGLEALTGTGTSRVLIHDVARPCVSQAVIEAVIDALDGAPGAAPALAVTDALWTGADDVVTGTRERDGLFRAQTPQGFHLAAIRAAHAAHPGGAADDVEVARATGMTVVIVPGDEDNLKITLPGDFARAERILRDRDGH
ncbi:2-C-methyl-D-erythritol 4-phosphate cytidylyltransferase/2-C-methyl-D-erythritol 4-phosphate cytidylyltransferase / 2-C-methyl-D-erythritol 2,4-cyclodiphosphate synthase [Sedimentitalea nanhaiensis]|uniref:2-C-methyl-D-erythritol 4-phosphate cytidylyltransferase n=1 Tax=Sedimentitalea nanhaiensis TaxID=999627 RepID=A0A1I6YHH5_9RHOB|nr:2-C-methyl-D-erythritol 4-phosphate cytidylyltransferase/2-C-methyl-D-erythritol 4-phosphate cytidylyltransferase / 2-C-methyl-D-erythritol 2,4-cyclodiphosphate synthase [Sedimentitalea nanhaiensis]